ncbi:hypothetical protein HaLaN_07973 [Haematococcus lacustris]|uniref:Uncharacterized protein n=1 Tax=Haematococcus lacustris TaxID=44745 RepID=A0A699YZB2_HAELA|nr:hypothetical protein HaLaN_07973 [Haematococcus lacustris]
MDSSQLASSLYSFACLGYLDSSVRDLAAYVAKAKLTKLAALKPEELTNLLYARSVFFALCAYQAVSSGHSQLASEPQLDSMAEALWKECSRRESFGQQWSEQDLMQLYTATHCESGPSSQAKLDLEQLVAEVEDLPVQLSSSEGKQLVQVVQDMEDWDRLEESSRDQLTQALLLCLGVAEAMPSP